MIRHRSSRQAPVAQPLSRPAGGKIWTPRAVYAASGTQSAPFLVRLLLGIFLVVVQSRLIEILPLRPLPVVGLILLAYGLVTSRWRDWLTARPTLLLFAITALMVPSALFGDWPGGSILMLANTWSRCLLFYLIVVCLGRGLAGVAVVMSSMAWATVAVVFMAFFLATGGTRLAIGDLGLSNPNDLAEILVVGLPFCGWYVLSSGRAMILRIVVAAASACALLMLLRTGSRMGLLALLCVVIALLVMSRGKLRLMLTVGALLGAIGSIFLVPKEMQQRYETMVDSDVAEDEQDNRDVGYAIGSAESRWSLFVTSLQVTMHHPLLGVGLGNFVGANAKLSKRPGQKGSWQVTHNSYTQVSSECGIPAAILYVAMFVFCLRTTNRLRKTMERDPQLHAYAPVAFWLYIAVVAFAVCAMFGSLAYGFQLMLLAGTAVTLEGAVVASQAQPAASPVPTR